MENMGINELATKEFKRAFRWLFELKTKTNKIDNLTVKSVDFPSFKVEKYKRIWEPITVEYYDVPEESEILWNWLLHEDDATWSPKCTAYLTYLTGDGTPIEGFQMILDLKEFSTTKPDYSNSEPCVIRLCFEVKEILKSEKVKVDAV